MYKRNNLIRSHENLFNIGTFYEDYIYYDVDKKTQKDLDITYLDGEGQNAVKRSLIQTKLYRDNTEYTYERKIYGFLDLLSDLGGVLEVVLLAFGFFVTSVSEHSFYTNAISALYMANTSNPKLFGKR